MGEGSGVTSLRLPSIGDETDEGGDKTLVVLSNDRRAVTAGRERCEDVRGCGSLSGPC